MPPQARKAPSKAKPRTKQAATPSDSAVAGEGLSAAPAGDARSRIRDAMNQRLSEDAVRVLVDETLAAVVGTKVDCPACGETHIVRFPDFKQIVATITALLDQAEGKPEADRVEGSSVTIVRPPL